MRPRGIWLLVVAGLWMCAGCSQPRQARYVIGMSQCNLGEPWRVQMNADIQAAVDEENAKWRAAGGPETQQYSQLIEIVFKDAQNDSLRQAAHVGEFVSDRVDLIIISPKEAAPLSEPVAKAYDAGIPVIVLDRAVLGDKYTCFIGADNTKIGRAAGKWLVEKLGGKGNVVELKGLMTSTPGQERHAGFREAIAGTDIKIVFEADMQWLKPNARKEMESALARPDRIDAVYAHNDPGAHGAYLAAKDAGREKEMLFVGIDALPHEGITWVKRGELSATFQYPTGGREAIETALKILAGQPVPKKIVLGSRRFTADSVDRGGDPIE